MCEKPETETETVTPRVAFATILQSLVAESPNKPTLPVMLSMLDQAMDHTGLRLELAAAPADHEDDVAKASRRRRLGAVRPGRRGAFRRRCAAARVGW